LEGGPRIDKNRVRIRTRFFDAQATPRKAIAVEFIDVTGKPRGVTALG